jgi:hypothetical protein
LSVEDKLLNESRNEYLWSESEEAILEINYRGGNTVELLAGLHCRSAVVIEKKLQELGLVEGQYSRFDEIYSREINEAEELIRLGAVKKPIDLSVEDFVGYVFAEQDQLAEEARELDQAMVYRGKIEAEEFYERNAEESRSKRDIQDSDTEDSDFEGRIAIFNELDETEGDWDENFNVNAKNEFDRYG